MYSLLFSRQYFPFPGFLAPYMRTQWCIFSCTTGCHWVSLLHRIWNRAAALSATPHAKSARALTFRRARTQRGAFTLHICLRTPPTVQTSGAETNLAQSCWGCVHRMSFNSSRGNFNISIRHECCSAWLGDVLCGNGAWRERHTHTHTHKHAHTQTRTHKSYIKRQLQSHWLSVHLIPCVRIPHISLQRYNS